MSVRYFLLFFVFAASPLFAGKSIRFGGGITAGAIKQPQSGELNYFGLPAKVGLSLHLLPKLSVNLDGGIVPDLASPQLGRTDVSAEVQYHVSGGVFRLSQESDFVGIIKSFKNAISLGTQIRYSQYAVSNDQRTSQKIDGSLLAFGLGGSFRFSQWELSAYFFPFSVPASTERVEESSVSILLRYHWPI